MTIDDAVINIQTESEMVVEWLAYAIERANVAAQSAADCAALIQWSINQSLNPRSDVACLAARQDVLIAVKNLDTTIVGIKTAARRLQTALSELTGLLEGQRSLSPFEVFDAGSSLLNIVHDAITSVSAVRESSVDVTEPLGGRVYGSGGASGGAGSSGEWQAVEIEHITGIETAGECSATALVKRITRITDPTTPDPDNNVLLEYHCPDWAAWICFAPALKWRTLCGDNTLISYGIDVASAFKRGFEQIFQYRTDYDLMTGGASATEITVMNDRFNYTERVDIVAEDAPWFDEDCNITNYQDIYESQEPPKRLINRNIPYTFEDLYWTNGTSMKSWDLQGRCSKKIIHIVIGIPHRSKRVGGIIGKVSKLFIQKGFQGIKLHEPEDREEEEEEWLNHL